MGLPIEQFKLFRYPWDTNRGLVYYFIWWFIFLIILYLSLKDSLHYIFIILPWGSILFVYLIFWIVRRVNYFYFSKKIQVVFAITLDYEDVKLKKLYDELIDNFREKLKDYRFAKSIKIRKKPVDIIFSDHSAAESKTKFNMPCSTLIISGLPIVSNQRTEFKLNFHYELRYPGGKDKEQFYKGLFQKRVSEAIEGKSWAIEDSVSSKSTFHSNTFNVSTYILSLCMVSLGNFDKAIDLLKPIIDECNSNVMNKNYGPLIANIKKDLFSINNIKFLQKYWSLDVDVLKPIVSELEKLDSSAYATYMSKAIVNELDGDREGARQQTRSAELVHPKNNYDFKFNDLYFNLSEHKYDKAVTILDSMESSIQDTFIAPIINFLYYQYNKTKDLALLFNIGVVILLWGESTLGKKELNLFIKSAKNKPEYRVLLDKAKGLILNN